MARLRPRRADGPCQNRPTLLGAWACAGTRPCLRTSPAHARHSHPPSSARTSTAGSGPRPRSCQPGRHPESPTGRGRRPVTRNSSGTRGQRPHDLADRQPVVHDGHGRRQQEQDREQRASGGRRTTARCRAGSGCACPMVSRSRCGAARGTKLAPVHAEDLDAAERPTCYRCFFRPSNVSGIRARARTASARTRRCNPAPSIRRLASASSVTVSPCSNRRSPPGRGAGFRPIVPAKMMALRLAPRRHRHVERSSGSCSSGRGGRGRPPRSRVVLRRLHETATRGVGEVAHRVAQEAGLHHVVGVDDGRSPRSRAAGGASASLRRGRPCRPATAPGG